MKMIEDIKNLEDILVLFNWLNGLTVEKYLKWVKEVSSKLHKRRVWFTQPPKKPEGCIPLEISKIIELMKGLGIGSTEIAEIPPEINPYAKEGIHILYKKEYTNPSGTAKDRPFSFMLFIYWLLGLLNNKKGITLAGAGNSAYSIAVLVAMLSEMTSNIRTIESYMGIASKRNPILISELEKNGVTIVECKDTQCPSVPSLKDGKPVGRGKAITRAWLEEVEDPEKVCFDQHGFWKIFDPILMSAAYYYTLGPEITNQVNKLFEGIQLEFCQGWGTRSSFLGPAAWFLENNPNANIFSHIPKEKQGPTFQFGLRRKNELGEAYILGLANNLCKKTYETPDKKAAEMFLTLLENEIPVCPSFAGNIYTCLRRAEELYKNGTEEAVIATLAFDGPYHYRTFLEQTLSNLLGINFKNYTKEFEGVVKIARREQREKLRKE